MNKQHRLTSQILKFIAVSSFIYLFPLFGQELASNEIENNTDNTMTKNKYGNFPEEDFFVKILTPVYDSTYSCESIIHFNAQLIDSRMNSLDSKKLTFVWFVNDSIYKYVQQFSQKLCAGSYKIDIGIAINGTDNIYFAKTNIKVASRMN